MRERPILFSAPMVRALLAGTKTQTRRVVKGIDPANLDSTMTKAQWRQVNRDRPVSFGPTYFCPYGQPGDRLWVRESFMDLRGTGVEHYDGDGCRQRYAFAADSPPGSYADETRKDYGLKWKPSIHMPRSACRLVLEITGVRVERLNDISQADAMAEGVWTAGAAKESGILDRSPGGGVLNHVGAFRNLWEEINGADAWQANPWVWVVEFRVLPPRTDGGGRG